ncbi:hypothetical protein PHYPO_G00048640 [Pangasianodon hypophthalmus]|uniref:Uncharacterized protein n=1 Tax=Pangasianodon hypophthalmus TaxID=310915 RepID=A0A5N5MIJ3_PANHP|nr:hypothetical protein PHYPO_G00048640 [Pangasianodon hypophthalmus]
MKLPTVLFYVLALAGFFAIQVTNAESFSTTKATTHFITTNGPTNTPTTMPSKASTTNDTTPSNATTMTPTNHTSSRNIYSTFKDYHHSDATKCHSCDAINHHNICKWHYHNDDTKQLHCGSMEIDFWDFIGQHDDNGNKRYHGDSVSYSYYNTTIRQHYSSF